MKRRTTDFQTIRSEGGLLPPDLLRVQRNVVSDVDLLHVLLARRSSGQHSLDQRRELAGAATRADVRIGAARSR